jgi:hypothetical protein
LQFAKLIGQSLKGDELLDILELRDVDVIYDYDRTHEGMEDVYWAACEAEGFQFRFDENQNLDVVFLYIEESEDFTPIDRSKIDVDVFESFLDAKNSFESRGLNYQNSPSEDPEDDWYQRWIRVNHENYTAHYEFRDKKLFRITLSKLEN